MNHYVPQNKQLTTIISLGWEVIGKDDELFKIRYNNIPLMNYMIRPEKTSNH